MPFFFPHFANAGQTAFKVSQVEQLIVRKIRPLAGMGAPKQAN